MGEGAIFCAVWEGLNAKFSKCKEFILLVVKCSFKKWYHCHDKDNHDKYNLDKITRTKTTTTKNPTTKTITMKTTTKKKTTTIKTMTKTFTLFFVKVEQVAHDWPDTRQYSLSQLALHCSSLSSVKLIAKAGTVRCAYELLSVQCLS